MKRIGWINVALLALVIALALFAWLRPSAPAADYKLSTQTPADAKHIEIAFGGNPPVMLERAMAGWQLTAPFTARAADFQVQNVLGLLGATAQEQLPAQHLERFELAAPRLRVTIDGQTFAFGAINELTREQYVLTQNTVYLLRLNYFVALPRNVWQLIDRQLFAPNETPVAFDFPDFKLAQQDGKWTLSPPPASELSQDDFNDWVDNWRLASALAIQPASHGKPLAMLKIKLRNGEIKQLAIMQRAPQLVLARADRPAFEYQFTADAAKRLLTPPGTGTKK